MTDREKVKEIIKGKIGECSCSKAYVSRRMTDPNCAWCEYHEDLICAFEEYRRTISPAPTYGNSVATDSTKAETAQTAIVLPSELDIVEYFKDTNFPTFYCAGAKWMLDEIKRLNNITKQ